MSRLSAVVESAVTQEMLDWYERRTEKHIGLVQKWAERIAAADPSLAELAESAKAHDASKLVEPERTPYVWVTWQYRCKESGRPFSCPDGMKERMNEATLRHVTGNPHHPEFWAPARSGLLNREDRDVAPAAVVDAVRMPKLHVAEMVADWCAMSEEKGTNVRDWMKRTIGTRWRFSEEQVRSMCEMVEGVGL